MYIHKHKTNYIWESPYIYIYTLLYITVYDNLSIYAYIYIYIHTVYGCIWIIVDNTTLKVQRFFGMIPPIPRASRYMTFHWKVVIPAPVRIKYITKYPSGFQTWTNPIHPDFVWVFEIRRMGFLLVKKTVLLVAELDPSANEQWYKQWWVRMTRLKP